MRFIDCSQVNKATRVNKAEHVIQVDSFQLHYIPNSNLGRRQHTQHLAGFAQLALDHGKQPLEQGM